MKCIKKIMISSTCKVVVPAGKNNYYTHMNGAKHRDLERILEANNVAVSKEADGNLLGSLFGAMTSNGITN